MDSDKSHHKYKYLLLNLNILHFFGLWPSYDSSWRCGRYLLYAFLASSVVCTFFVSVWVATFVTDGDLSELTDILSVGLTNLSNGFKLFPFWFMRGKLVRMVRTLHEDLYALGTKHWCSEKDVIIRGSAKSIRVLTLAYVTWYVFTCGSWLLTSLVIMPSADSLGNITVRTLPYPGWFPYDEKLSPAYEISYIFQAVGAMLDTIDAAIMDCFYIAVVIHTYTQFKLLQVSLRNIRVDAMQLSSELKKTGVHPKIIPSGRNVAEEIQTRMKEHLNDCIRYHQMIFGFIDEVQALLGPITLVECIVMSFILCTISYQATIVPLSSLKFLTMVAFLVCESSRLLMYCWVGTELRWQSARVHTAAFETEWYSADPGFKRSVGIVMVRALRPSELRAYKFAAMTLDLFTTLLRASYSYYAVLRQIDNEEADQ